MPISRPWKEEDIFDDITRTFMLKPKDPIRFMAGNYIERTTDAVYVEIGDATVYFANGKTVAVIASDCLYRVAQLDSGIIYKRIRAALMRQNPKKIQQVTRPELDNMVKASLMAMASRLINEELGVEAR